jgi:hypothetical protein
MRFQPTYKVRDVIGTHRCAARTICGNSDKLRGSLFAHSERKKMAEQGEEDADLVLSIRRKTQSLNTKIDALGATLVEAENSGGLLYVLLVYQAVWFPSRGVVGHAGAFSIDFAQDSCWCLMADMACVGRTRRSCGGATCSRR